MTLNEINNRIYTQKGSRVIMLSTVRVFTEQTFHKFYSFLELTSLVAAGCGPLSKY